MPGLLFSWGINKSELLRDGTICEQFEECDDGNTTTTTSVLARAALCLRWFLRKDLSEGGQAMKAAMMLTLRIVAMDVMPPAFKTIRVVNVVQDP